MTWRLKASENSGSMPPLQPAMIEIVRDVVKCHPKVLSGEGVPLPEQPDAEIESFGESGVNILVEFCIEGIDDGENRVGLIKSETAFKVSQQMAEASATRPEIVGDRMPRGRPPLPDQQIAVIRQWIADGAQDN